MVVRVLITGICGFIGNALNAYIRRQLEGDVEIWGVDNMSTGTNMAGVDRRYFVEGDICNVSTFETLPDVDYIFHLACPASPHDYLRLSVETMQACSAGTANVLLYMQSHVILPVMVYASSSEVYGDPEVHPQPETYCGNVNVNFERSLYAEGKRFAEALIGCMVRENAMDVRIARLFNVYGPGMKEDDGRIIPSFISAVSRGEPLMVHRSGGRDVSRTYCHVNDMVRMLFRMSTCNRPDGPVNLGSDAPGNERTNLELAELVLELARDDDVPVLQSEVVIVDGGRMGDPRRRRPDLTVARRLFGDEFMMTIELEDGLRELRFR